ncbi:hypothetical protein HNP86_000975 [Methanococcus maripaludis]|uniref:Uncharacterized protein n=1 Tax=Methanococcus maripaludis TaxID=39152 RepID=A0A7J9NU61_METMI|nr:hypothetical protein [Methanococcus maripaludis]
MNFVRIYRLMRLFNKLNNLHDSIYVFAKFEFKRNAFFNLLSGNAQFVEIFGIDSKYLRIGLVNTIELRCFKTLLIINSAYFQCPINSITLHHVYCAVKIAMFLMLGEYSVISMFISIFISLSISIDYKYNIIIPEYTDRQSSELNCIFNQHCSSFNIFNDDYI